jgi:DNA-binding transcriptional ArsR family regulator
MGPERKPKSRRTGARRADALGGTAQLTKLEARLAALEAQLAGVEGAAAQSRPGRAQRREALGLDVDLLERLAAQGGQGAVRGGVLYAAAVTLDADGAAEPTAPPPQRVVWQRDHLASDLLEDVEPAAVVRPLFALAHETRIRIVLALARAPHTGPELVELADAESTGQLYHHLGELARVGIVVQPRRGQYHLRAAGIGPVLAILAASLDLGAPAG